MCFVWLNGFSHLVVVVVVVPLLQKGALLRGDRGPAALRRRVDLRGKGAAEALHRARVRREALEEAGVNRGGDAGVEVVRLGGGDRVYCVSGVGDGRRRGARLHGPRRSESGQGGRNRAAAGALHLRERGRREHVIAAGAVVDVVRAGGLHLGLHLGRWRIGVQAVEEEEEEEEEEYGCCCCCCGGGSSVCWCMFQSRWRSPAVCAWPTAEKRLRSLSAALLCSLLDWEAVSPAGSSCMLRWCDEKRGDTRGELLGRTGDALG